MRVVKHIVVPEQTYDLILEQVKPRIEKVEHHKIPAKPISGIVQKAFELIIEAIDAGSLEHAEWIYSPKAEPTNDQIVQLLRKANDPKLARYLYKTFGTRRLPEADFIFKEMCDEDSPFFLPYVKDALSDLIILKEEKESVSDLQKRKSKLQSEIEEMQNDAQKFTSKIEELTVQKTQLEQEVDEYNRQMFRVSTFTPVTAVDNVFTALDEVEKRERPGREWDAQLAKHLIEARDLALALKEHYHQFDATKLKETWEEKKLKVVRDLEDLENRNFSKWWLKLKDELNAIKKAQTWEAEQIVHGNYWMSADNYVRMDKIKSKIDEVFYVKK